MSFHSLLRHQKVNLTERRSVKGRIWIEAGKGPQGFFLLLLLLLFIVVVAVVLILCMMKPWTLFHTFYCIISCSCLKPPRNHSIITGVWSWNQLSVSLKSLVFGANNYICQNLERALNITSMNFSTSRLSVSFLHIKSLWIILKIPSNQIKAKIQLFVHDKDFVPGVN